MKVFHILIFAALFQLSPECETNPDSSDIVNGQVAKLGEFPHQLLLIVHLKSGKIYNCGAVIINKMQALTAAHCVDFPDYDSSFIKAGVVNRYWYSQVLDVESFVMHPKWINASHVDVGYDIAVLTFRNPLYFNDHVQPIEWNKDPNLNFAGETCKISGWGLVESYMSTVNLQKTNTSVLTDDECKKTMRGLNYKDICVYSPGISSCNGDSGGPLTCYKDGKPLLVGIASYVRGREVILNGEVETVCDPMFPNVYAEVANYGDFISKHIYSC